MKSFLWESRKEQNHALRSSPPELFIGKPFLKICSKFTGEHPCRNVISIKLLCNFIEFALQHGCCPINMMHIFRTPSYKNTYGELLLCTVLSLINSNTENKISPGVIRSSVVQTREIIYQTRHSYSTILGDIHIFSMTV